MYLPHVSLYGLNTINSTNSGKLLPQPGGVLKSLGSHHTPAQPIELEQIRAKATECLVDTAIAGLRVLPAGPSLAINPAELLSLPETRLLLQTLQEMADVVIVDTPPVLPVADAMVLAAQATGVILVIDAKRTRAREARMAHESLRQAGAHVLGVVLNRAPISSSTYYAYPPGGVARDTKRDSLHSAAAGSHQPVRSTRRSVSVGRGRGED